MSREKLAALEKLQAIDLQVDELTTSGGCVPRPVGRTGAEGRRRPGPPGIRSGVGSPTTSGAANQIEQQLTRRKGQGEEVGVAPPAAQAPCVEFAALEREITSAKKTNDENEETLAQLQLDASPCAPRCSRRTPSWPPASGR